MRYTRGAVLAIAAAGSLAACSSDGSGPSAGAQLTLNVATEAGLGGAAGSPDTTTIGADVLVINSVELVLRDVEFEKQNSDACDSLSTGHDACEEVNAGPVLLDLPLGAGATHAFTATIDSGTYDEIELKLHKPEDDGGPADQAFLAAHPDLKDISVRVTGTFNGTPFTWTTDVNAEQELDLQPPLTVDATGSAEATLFVDIHSWFLQAGGAALIDPALALKGGAFEGVVSDNIKASFEAFEDEDHDGSGDD
jgi:hypothetical protein